MLFFASDAKSFVMFSSQIEKVINYIERSFFLSAKSINFAFYIMGAVSSLRLRNTWICIMKTDLEVQNILMLPWISEFISISNQMIIWTFKLGKKDDDRTIKRLPSSTS